MNLYELFYLENVHSIFQFKGRWGGGRRKYRKLKIWLQAIIEREQSVKSRDLGSNTETNVYYFKTRALFVKIFYKIGIMIPNLRGCSKKYRRQGQNKTKQKTPRIGPSLSPSYVFIISHLFSKVASLDVTTDCKN